MSATARISPLQFRLLELQPPRVKPALVPEPEPLPTGEKEEVRRIRASLQGSVAAKVMNATELIRSLAIKGRQAWIPTTLPPFDALLGGGLARGKLTELTGRRCSGRFSIVLASLAAATSMGEAAVLVDLGDHFDPQLAEANGVDLRRLLWIRAQTIKQAVMAVEMIAVAGFQLVVLDAGMHPIQGRRVAEAAWVRLARTAEAQGTAMLISTPYSLTGTASEAVVSAGRGKAEWRQHGKGPRVLAGSSIELLLEKHRQQRPGRTAILKLRWFEAIEERPSGKESAGSGAREVVAAAGIR